VERHRRRVRQASRLRPLEPHALDDRLPPVTDEILLKGQGAVLDRVHLGRQQVVGDRQQPVPHPQGLRQPGCDGGQRHAARQPVRTQHVRRHVAIAQAKPGVFPITAQHVQHAPRLALQAPSRRRVGDACQRVHDRVEVRGNVKPVQLEIIGHVTDHGELIGCEDFGQAVDQLGPAHPAD